MYYLQISQESEVSHGLSPENQFALFCSIAYFHDPIKPVANFLFQFFSKRSLLRHNITNLECRPCRTMASIALGDSSKKLVCKSTKDVADRYDGKTLLPNLAALLFALARLPKYECPTTVFVEIWRKPRLSSTPNPHSANQNMMTWCMQTFRTSRY